MYCNVLLYCMTVGSVWGTVCKYNGVVQIVVCSNVDNKMGHFIIYCSVLMYCMAVWSMWGTVCKYNGVVQIVVCSNAENFPKFRDGAHLVMRKMNDFRRENGIAYVKYTKWWNALILNEKQWIVCLVQGWRSCGMLAQNSTPEVFLYMRQ